MPTLAARLADLTASRPADTDPAPAQPGTVTPDAPAEVELTASGNEPTIDATSGESQAPAEGYDSEHSVFIKRYNLGAPGLHLLGADELAEHSQTAGLPDAAARAAREYGYAPTGPAVFVHGAPDGDKSAISLAVPVNPRVPAIPATTAGD